MMLVADIVAIVGYFGGVLLVSELVMRALDRL